jgi:deoxyhypusine synthase
VRPDPENPKRILRDGRGDGLEPLEPLDLQRVKSCSDLVRAMAKTAFGGRRLGEALDVFLAMVRDPDCLVVGTFSGAMTVAKMGKIICDMIDRGMLDVIVSTGALVTHGLTEAAGLTHYKHEPGMNDAELFEKGYNRVYDTLEMETNLNEVSKLFREALRDPEPDQPWSSERVCRAIGKLLVERTDEPGILKSAYLKQVPVYIPALTDCELGLDMASFALVDYRDAINGPGPLTPFSIEPNFNPFLDLNSYARRAHGATRLGIFTIGGGVPRNWAQQVGPYVDFLNYRHGFDLKQVRFQYGVRICPEPAHWGGLSGCTYSEGVSWGKFLPPSEGGRYAEVYADATIAWPILIKAALEELDKAGGDPQ